MSITHVLASIEEKKTEYEGLEKFSAGEKEKLDISYEHIDQESVNHFKQYIVQSHGVVSSLVTLYELALKYEGDANRDASMKEGRDKYMKKRETFQKFLNSNVKIASF